MNDNPLTRFLGQCWAFPPHFSLEGVKMTKGIEAVRQSLRVLFMTEPGERIMREAWGCGMNTFLFENMTDALEARIQNHIEEGILRSEHRVTLKDVVIKSAVNDVNRMHILITVHLTGSDIDEVIDGTLDLNAGQMLRLL